MMHPHAWPECNITVILYFYTCHSSNLRMILPPVLAQPLVLVPLGEIPIAMIDPARAGRILSWPI